MVVTVGGVPVKVDALEAVAPVPSLFGVHPTTAASRPDITQ
jgi:hypothetical protein